jgi:hypothetical protein
MANTKKVKRTNYDLQNITQKIKNRVAQTPLKTGGELGCSGRDTYPEIDGTFLINIHHI